MVVANNESKDEFDPTIFKSHLEVVFCHNKAFVTNMCFDEWNVNKQLTKVLKI